MAITTGNVIKFSEIPSTYVKANAAVVNVTAARGIQVPYLTIKRNRYNETQTATQGGYISFGEYTNSDPTRGYFSVENDKFYIGSTDTSVGNLFYLNLNSGYGYFYAYKSGFLDYAEYRKSDITEAGRCITETKSGIMTITTERLQPGCHIISDTYQLIIGKMRNNVPIGLKGIVLAYPYQPKENYQIGDSVCSAPNGTIDIMTREEIKTYPERIIGTVFEIPTEEEYQRGKQTIKVNSRIWIKLN